MRRTQFDTLSEFVDHVKALPWRNNGHWAARSSFAGGSLDDAIRLATFGWPEGTERAVRKATAITDRVIASTAEGSAPCIDYDVTGAAFDAGAVALGIPEAWARPGVEPSRHAIRMVLNCGTSAGVSNEVIEQRGIAVVALALTFIARGYPVTIDVQISNVIQYSKDVTIRVADAASGAPLDIDRVTYALAHPTMLRQLQRANYNGCRNGSPDDGRNEWGSDSPASDTRPSGHIDLFMGGAHLSQTERWRDGGESWILAEYLRQTTDTQTQMES